MLILGVLVAHASCRSGQKQASGNANVAAASGSEGALPTAGLSIPDAAAVAARTDDEPVRVDPVQVPNDLAAYVVRGGRGSARLVFLHGLCGNAEFYARSFQHAAASKGTLIAIQGNAPCEGAYRDWSTTPEKVNERIEAAFRASGDSSELRDLVLIGYSSGGLFAEILAMRWPDRYTRVVLIALPSRPATYRLRKVRGAVMMAPEVDRHDLMEEGARQLRAEGIRSTFLVLPGATHGGMGREPERAMSEALDWLWSLEAIPQDR